MVRFWRRVAPWIAIVATLALAAFMLEDGVRDCGIQIAPPGKSVPPVSAAWKRSSPLGLTVERRRSAALVFRVAWLLHDLLRIAAAENAQRQARGVTWP